MGVRADFFVCFLDERRELSLREAFILHVHLYGETKTAAIARSNCYGTRHSRVFGILFVLFGDKVDGAPKTGRVTGGKQVFGSSSMGFAWPTHFLGYRKIGLHRAVVSFRMAIAAALT